MTWTPLGSQPEAHPALVPGIPQWMRGSLRAWFVQQFSRYDSAGSHLGWDVSRMRRYDLAARSQPLAEMLSFHGGRTLFDSLEDDQILRIIDWVVMDRGPRDVLGKTAALEKILRDGGSSWKVGVRNGTPGLEDRVPLGVQDAADQAMSTPGDAGRLLSEAWQAVYGINPQPDLGYRKSIEAVEAVVIPQVMKNDATATLGKAIGQMRAQGDWKLPFVKEHSQNPSQDVVLGMLQALWSGHSDRHPGTAVYVLSSQEAAEAAVSIAVSLVNLFASGGIARR